MSKTDALEPLIDHLGVFAGAVSDPITAGMVCLLALWLRRYDLFLGGAALIGASDAALEEFVQTAPMASLPAALALGAAASLVQGWCLWTCITALRWLRRAVATLFGSGGPGEG